MSTQPVDVMTPTGGDGALEVIRRAETFTADKSKPVSFAGPAAMPEPISRAWFSGRDVPPGLHMRVSPDPYAGKFTLLKLDYRFPDDSGLSPITDAAAAAKARAEQLAGDVLAELADSPEAERERVAAEARRSAAAEVESAKEKLATLKREYDTMLADGKNPAPLVREIRVVEGELEATETWFAGLASRHDQAAAELRNVAAQRRAATCDAQASVLQDRRAALQAKAERYARELADELLSIDAGERAIVQPFPMPVAIPVVEHDEVIERRAVKSRRK